MNSASISRSRTPVSPLRGSRALAGRLKVVAVAASMAGFGAVWSLVSLNVVGATNQPSPAKAAAPASVPSGNFFGQTRQQPQPQLFANGGSGGGFGNAPVIRSRTS